MKMHGGKATINYPWLKNIEENHTNILCIWGVFRIDIDLQFADGEKKLSKILIHINVKKLESVCLRPHSHIKPNER